MKLKPTRQEYEWKGRDGYGFKVVCEDRGDGGGWAAHVTMTTHGFVTPEDALRHLRLSAEAFLRQVPSEAK